MIDYYYKHGTEATVEKYNYTRGYHIGSMINHLKRKFGLSDKYRGRRKPMVKKGA